MDATAPSYIFISSSSTFPRSFATALAILLIVGGAFGPSARGQINQKVISECTECGPLSVHAVDVDGDDHIDILAAFDSDDQIVWYENDGSSDPSFTAHTITTNADGARNVYAADIDGDGDTDILSASDNDDKIAWYENDGSSDPSFTAHPITTNADGANSVHAADVDGDGDTDVLSASYLDDKVAWYENDGSADPSFTTRKITTNDVENVYAADVDGDGDTDVLSASKTDDEIVWHENDGNSNPNFTAHSIHTGDNGARSVYATDIDADNDTDILAGLYYDDEVAWHENDGSADPSFTKHTITNNANGARNVYATDIDEDGDTDLLAAIENDDKIAWYENDGSSDPSFTAHTITTNAEGANSVHAADVDGDGDKDILSASWGDDKIAWYENTDGVLPVELASLTARAEGSGARLTWKTASETNNTGFYIQHQEASQKDWTHLGFVEGSGTTSNPQTYRFETGQLAPGTHKFRLRQIDTDGTAHFSRVVSTEIQMRKKARLTAPAPNPASSTARLTFAVKESEKATVTLYNALGKRIATLYEGHPTSGEHVSLQLDTSTLASGAYIVRLKSRGVLKTRKITVVK